MEKLTFKNPTIEVISFESGLYTFDNILEISGDSDKYEIRIPTGK